MSSPNMNMNIPVVGTTPAPQWATLIVSCFNVIDSHDHTTGSGLPITPGAMNINSDLSFGSNNATALRVARFTSQSAYIPATGSELSQVYVADGELYYNDGAGNVVPITNGGSVNAGAGSITGLPSGTASASFVAASEKFVWQSATNTAADMDMRAAILRNSSVSSYGLTLQPPTLSGNYSITLPALPVSQKIVTLDASGVMSAAWAADNSTLEVSANVLQVKAGGITTTQISASAGILGTQLSTSAGILGSQLSASAAIAGSQLASDANFSGSSVSAGSLKVITSSTNASTGLKIIRGDFDCGGSYAFIAGEGFTGVRNSSGDATITFTSPFASLPVVVAMSTNVTASPVTTVGSPSTTTVRLTGATRISFIAIGPR